MTVMSRSQLQALATLISEETASRANTAQRVGGALLSLAESAQMLLEQDSGVSVVDYGAATTATAAVNTAAFQSAVDEVSAAGGGTVSVPPGLFNLGPSTLGATYYNYIGVGGEVIAASAGCLVLRSNVRLVGQGIGITKLKPSSPSLDVLYIVDGNNSVLSDLEIDGGWVGSGAGHAILWLLSTADNTIPCANALVQRVYCHDVASYGLGMQNCVYTNVTVRDFKTKNTGADGLDIKNRPWPANDSKGVTLDNIYVETPGLRLDGQTGVDMRGIVHASNITVVGVGRAGVQMSGIRMRTAGADEGWGDRCTLTGFYVRATSSATASTLGVDVGGSNCSVVGGVIEDCKESLTIGGNGTETADGNVISGVVGKTAGTRAFFVYAGNGMNRFIGCSAIDSAIGFRNEGNNTSFIGNGAENCVSPFENSVTAFNTETIAGNQFYADSLNLTFVTAGRVGLEARGTSTDIDIAAYPKGAGLFRFGVKTGAADAASDGYVTVKTEAGVTIKLATRA